MSSAPLNVLAEQVWRDRYRAGRPDGSIDDSIAATLERVAGALAAPEADPAFWTGRFLGLLAGFRFLPGGRILAGAGARGAGMLLNCFVLGPIRDSREGVLEALREGIVTLVPGGGVGWDLSTLQPAGARAGGATGIGPVGCLKLFDAACEAFTAGSARGGAMMATLRADHGDIEAFVAAKRAPGALPRFNLSVQLTDRFLRAVVTDAPWPLPAAPSSTERSTVLPARELWSHFLQHAWACSEPGALFVDTINRENNLGWREQLTATNPCGEAPLPSYGACDLGSLNLARFVREPFTASASVDRDALAAAAGLAVRLLDNVLDVTTYPLPRQREEALTTRRIGLGLTGLGDALAMLGLPYDSPEARQTSAGIGRCIKLAAYEASATLAAEKGAFPAYDRDRYLAAPFVGRLPASLRDRIARQGIRNSHLLAIAPTGSVSLLAGNVSPGLEPITARRQLRRLRTPGGGQREYEVDDYAWALYSTCGEGRQAAFVDAAGVSPHAQVAMQAALQGEVDGAISKTVLLPDDYPVQDLGGLFLEAHGAGLKGLAVHRMASARGSVVGPGCAAGIRTDASCDDP